MVSSKPIHQYPRYTANLTRQLIRTTVGAAVNIKAVMEIVLADLLILTCGFLLVKNEAIFYTQTSSHELGTI